MSAHYFILDKLSRLPSTATVDVATDIDMRVEFTFFPPSGASVILPQHPVTVNGFASSSSVVPDLFTCVKEWPALVKVDCQAGPSHMVFRRRPVIGTVGTAIRTSICLPIPSVQVTSGMFFMFPIGEPGALILVGNPNYGIATAVVRYGLGLPEPGVSVPPMRVLAIHPPVSNVSVSITSDLATLVQVVFGGTEEVLVLPQG